MTHTCLLPWPFKAFLLSILTSYASSLIMQSSHFCMTKFWAQSCQHLWTFAEILILFLLLDSLFKCVQAIKSVKHYVFTWIEITYFHQYWKQSLHISTKSSTVFKILFFFLSSDFPNYEYWCILLNFFLYTSIGSAKYFSHEEVISLYFNIPYLHSISSAFTWLETGGVTV